MGDPRQPAPQCAALGIELPGSAGRRQKRFLHDVGHVVGLRAHQPAAYRQTSAQYALYSAVHASRLPSRKPRITASWSCSSSTGRLDDMQPLAMGCRVNVL